MKKIALALIIHLFCFLSLNVHADEDLYWIGINSDQWDDPVNWYPYKDTDQPYIFSDYSPIYPDPALSGYSNNSHLNRLPTTGDDLFLNNSNVGNYEDPAQYFSVNYEGTSATDTFYAVHLNNGMTLNQNSGNIVSDEVWLAQVGSAVWNQYAGVTETNQNFTIGLDRGSSGYYIIDGPDGTLLDVGHDMIVGYRGNGFLEINSGRLNVENNLTAGFWRDSYGQLTFNGTSEVYIDDALHIGNYGDGFVIQNGFSDVEIRSFLSIGLYGMGGYEINDQATLHTQQNILIGVYEGSGDFFQNGFDTIVGTDHDLILGEYQGTSGNYTLDEGTLNVGGTALIGKYGSASFTQNNYFSDFDGINVTENLILGNADEVSKTQGIGNYTLESGPVKIGQNLIVGQGGEGYWTQYSNSKVFVNNDVVVGSAQGLVKGTGFLQLHGGELTSTQLFVGANGGTGEFSQYGGKVKLNESLILGQDTGMGIYRLDDGMLEAKTAVIGKSGTGYFYQTGGNHTLETTLTIGEESNSEAVYYLEDGILSLDLSTADNKFIIGDSGKGTFSFNGGIFQNRSLQTPSLILGNTQTGDGTLQIFSDVSTDFKFKDLTLGNFGHGSLEQNAGAVAITDTFTIGKSSTSNGTYHLSSGTINGIELTVADSGKGAIDQDGGIFALEKGIIIGKEIGSIGEYHLNNGILRLHQNGNDGNDIIGDKGLGTFTIHKGTIEQPVEKHHDLVLGKTETGEGIFNILSNDGSIEYDNETIGSAGKGQFLQSGGTNKISHMLVLGEHKNGDGTYSLQQGTLLSAFYGALYSGSGVIIGKDGQGVFNHTDGTHIIGDESIKSYFDLTLGYSQNAEGTYNLQNGQLTASTVNIGVYGKGTFNQSGGTNVIKEKIVLGTSILGGEGYYFLEKGQIEVDSDSQGTHYIGLGGKGKIESVDGIFFSPYQNMVLGKMAKGDGTYTMSGLSILQVKGLTIADSGFGEFIQDDGTVFAREKFVMANEAAGFAAYTLRAGTLRTGFSDIPAAEDTIIGVNGEAAFTQMGGEVFVGDSDLFNMFIIGQYENSHGDYFQLNGSMESESTLVVGDQGRGGFLQQGDVLLKRSLIVGREGTGEGYYTLNDGVLTVGESALRESTIGEIGKGTFFQNGGQAIFHNELTIGSDSDVKNNGQYVMAGGTLQVLNGLTNNSIFSCEGNCRISGSQIVNNGRFNIDQKTPGLTMLDIDISNAKKALFRIENATWSNSKEVENSGLFEIQSSAITFTNTVTNHHYLKVVDSNVSFTGDFYNYGGYESDPSENYFSFLTIYETGYLIGDFGDKFLIGGDFLNYSTQTDLWDTENAYLGFVGNNIAHNYSLTDTSSLFSWNTLFLGSGNSLLFTGNSDWDLYFSNIVLEDGLDQLAMISTGRDLYYDNLWDGQGNLFEFHDYILSGGGQLKYRGGTPDPNTVPEPATFILFVSGLLGFSFTQRKIRT